MNLPTLIFLFLEMTFLFINCENNNIKNPDLPHNDPDQTFQQLNTSSFNFQGHNRNYIVFLPKNYSDSINFSLVVYLHSYGWNAEQGMNYTKLNEAAEGSDFIVVYPNGTPNWNSGVGDNPKWPAPNVDDVGFINALIDTVSNHYSINLKRVYACGYSNGGFMAYKLASLLSNRFAAIASVCGAMSYSTEARCNTLHSMPIMEVHGTSDTWVPFGGDNGWNSVDHTIDFWTDYNNCSSSSTTDLPDLDATDGCNVEKTIYTNCSNGVQVILYKVNHGGHTWPGADPPNYEAGNTNNDFNASVEILKFFKNYKLD